MKLNPEALEVTPFVTTCEHQGAGVVAYDVGAPEIGASEIDHGGGPGPCTCWC